MSIDKKRRIDTLRALSLKLGEILLELNGAKQYATEYKNNISLVAEPDEMYGTIGSLAPVLFDNLIRTHYAVPTT